jgi:UDP-N-acetylmuramyl pentapeptide phosphotransferase/UDP-N-acetylglucosamine-1-phosphate transferase
MSLLSALIAFVVAWLAIRVLLVYGGHLPQDVPNARSLHQRAVPRGGGLAIWAGWFAATLWLPEPRPWLAPLIALIAISLIDDLRAIPALLRLLVHAAAAAAWIWLADAAIEPVIAVVVIVWAVNLYNFMDGSDGLAGAMTVIGFGSYATAAWLAGGAPAASLLALATATIPFLFYNSPPAKLFMGDAGSVPLGFLAAVFGLTGWTERWWPAWFPVLVFLPFIADASVTLVRRLLRGARVWHAHREHCYQRLVRLGWGHAGTLALYAGLMAGGAATALAALRWAPSLGGAALGLWAAVLGSLFIITEYHWRRRGAEFEESKG